MQRFLLIISFSIFFSCSRKLKSENFNPEITIGFAQSYKYDLTNHVYTVFNFNQNDTAISFNLSVEEHRKISEKYYKLQLDSLQDGTVINDIYDSEPILYDYIKTQTGKQIQYITIEGGKEKEYKPEDILIAKKINDFIDFVMSILKSKPEIKNAPKSDVGYM